jgi:uncharacterized Zn finger protein
MQQQQTSIPFEKTLPIVCDKCGNDRFTSTFLLRRVSKFLTAAPQDSITPALPTFACASCGHVNEEFDIQVKGEGSDDEE